MGKTFIFAIGGTGARVLRSLTMLMASGVKGLDGDICPIIIDYDEHNGDKDRAITTMKKYSEIQKLVEAGKPLIDSALREEEENRSSKGNKKNNKSTENEVKDKYFTHFFKTKCVDILNNWSWKFDVKGDANQTFREYISYDNIANYSPSTQNFMDCLYDTDNQSVYTELNLNMRQGFQGNPNIGSVVFNELKECDEFNKFTNAFTETDRIIIIGSIFGGTGSSGIPKIVSALQQVDKVKTADISVILVLPYFAVDTSNKEEISIKSSIFNSKTKAALNYYEKSGLNKLINRIYYIGDKTLTKVKPHIGDKAQKNNAHIVELIAAMAVAHTITSGPAGQQGLKYKFSSTDTIKDGIGFKELIGDTNKWNSNDFVRGILHNMINFVYAMRYYLDYIVTSNKDLDQTNFYKELHLDFEDKKTKSIDKDPLIQDYCAALYDFICRKDEMSDGDDGFWPWMTELHSANHEKHRLKMFQLDCADIVDILDGYSFRYEVDESSMFKVIEKRKNREPLMKYRLFDQEMNNNTLFESLRQGQKKLENYDDIAYVYIFNYMLSDLTNRLRTKTTDKKVVEKFKKIP